MERILLCILIGFAVSLVISPLVIKLMRMLKANQTIYEYVDMHKSKSNTPTMGGVIFIVGAILSSILCFMQHNTLAFICIACFLSFGIIGFLDDFLKIHKKQNEGLKPYQKIIGQLAISIIVAVFAYQNVYIGSNVYLPFTSKTIELGWLFIPFAVFVFLAITNGVNLTDGLDGLAGGVSISYVFVFAIIQFIILSSLPNFDVVAYKEQLNILILCGGVVGALFAYLLFNSHPASIFMGDTGSLALGGLIASLAICTKQVLLIPILGVMFVASCVSVVMQVGYYKLTKKRIFKMAPYHHHLEKKGIHETKIVVIYIVITLVIGVIGILATKFINM